MNAKSPGLVVFPFRLFGSLPSRLCSSACLSLFLLVLNVPSQAQTVGGGTLASPAVGPAPAYDYGYGTGISSAVLVKNWDFGSGAGNTIHNISEMSTNFYYHDQFGQIVNNGNYGAKIVSPDNANRINTAQPVEGVNTVGPVREFFTSSLKTYLVPLNGATTLDPQLQNTGNGSFMAKWSAPNGGSLLGMDIIWETKVRYVTPPYFWFAIWTAGYPWIQPDRANGIWGGAEMDVNESFGYDNGGGFTNFDGRYWHSNTVGYQEETPYSSWGSSMANYGITTFDATQWHTWTWVYKADNTFTVYVDGAPVQRGEMYWTAGGRLSDPSSAMFFLYDASWGYKTIASVNHTLPASAMVGKYYEWDYSRVYYRQPTASDSKNLALTATISTVSSQEANNPASHLIDNIYNSDTNRWSPVSAGYPNYVELDLGSNKSITETELVNVANNSFKYKIEAKPDGGAYSTVVDRTALTSSSRIQSEKFSAVTARYVKLTVTGSTNSITWIGIREFKVIGTNASAPVSGDLAQGKPATASNVQFGTTLVAANAVDGNTSTRWSTDAADNQWIYVDLGSTQTINRVKLKWETAYASGYKIQTSNNASTWTDIYSTTTGNGGVDDVTGLSGSGRYVRVLGVTRATSFGISLFDFEVYGPAANSALGKPATASNVQFGTTLVAANAVDGNSTTRWSTDAADNQWIYVDLGATQTVSRVKLNWEGAYASGYKIQTSNNASTWTDIYTTTTGNGAIDDVTGLTGSGRYVRILCTTRATGFGISLWDFEVYP